MFTEGTEGKYITSELLAKYNGDKEAAADFLIGEISNGNITFPFKFGWLGDPKVLFDKIKTTDLKVQIGTKFFMKSYFPDHAAYLPPLFRNKFTLILHDPNDTSDNLSDYFLEDIRLKVRRYDQEKASMECWIDPACLHDKIIIPALNKPEINPFNLRETIYENIAEATTFRPSWAKALLKLVINSNLTNKKWLDISAGWGDRLLVAMALNMEYLGFDPNIELKPRHDQMIELFGNANRIKVIYEPFEQVDPQVLKSAGPFDVILSSPPYFSLEDYAPGQTGQSIVSYPQYEAWMVNFMYVSLLKAWEMLKIDGYLILHLGDTKTVKLVEPTNFFIEQFLPNASWEGAIGLQGGAGYARPVWVWRKVKAHPVYWSSKTSLVKDRKIVKTYPAIAKEWIKYNITQINPDYLIRYNNAKIVQDDLRLNLPNYNGNLSDLIITILLENDPDVVAWLINVLANPNRAKILQDKILSIYPAYPQLQKDISTIKQTLQITGDSLLDDLMFSSLLEVMDVKAVIEWLRYFF